MMVCKIGIRADVLDDYICSAFNRSCAQSCVMCPSTSRELIRATKQPLGRCLSFFLFIWVAISSLTF